MKVLGCALILTAPAFASEWFPDQKAPKGILTVTVEVASNPKAVLAESLAGLAARAVNGGTGDELIWLGGDPEGWKERTIKRLGAEDRGSLSLMEALTRHRRSVAGYVLYDYQNDSANRATVMAGQLGALLVDESQEKEIASLGFKPLIDVREMTTDEVYKHSGKNLNPKMVFSIRPEAAHMRGLAIAHRAYVDYRNDDSLWKIYDELTPPFAVLGWGAGDEFRHVAAATQRGGFETASDWARNLTVLAAGSADYRPKKIRSVDPETIDWNDTRPCVAFMMSDGDNTGWMLSNFWNEQYYRSPLVRSFPMGFSTALGGLTQLAPVVVDRFAEEQPEKVSLVQFGGGYFYPDLFAENHPKRWELLRQQARGIDAQMKRSGTTVMCFIVNDSASDDSKKAYRIFAEEIDSLAGMLVMDYAPYHKGAGAIHWVKNKTGQNIPAVTARYAMWEGLNHPRAGVPEKLAATINDDDQEFSWAAVHAWSKFKTDDPRKTVSGTAAIGSCIDRIDREKVHVVTPEELIWRIRKGR